jgi:hypothetical protein
VVLRGPAGKFNAIADMVKGATFNSEFYKEFKNTRKWKSKSNHDIDSKK